MITSSCEACLSHPPLSDSLPKTLRSRRKQRLVFSVTLSVMEKDANHIRRGVGCSFTHFTELGLGSNVSFLTYAFHLGAQALKSDSILAPSPHFLSVQSTLLSACRFHAKDPERCHERRCALDALSLLSSKQPQEAMIIGPILGEAQRS